MEYEVVFAPRAVADLQDIVLYITPDRPEAAKRLALALVERTRMLGAFPFSGPKVPEFDHPSIRELLLSPYRIVYRVDEAQKIVGVARFWHGAQDALAPDDLQPEKGSAFALCPLPLLLGDVDEGWRGRAEEAASGVPRRLAR